MGTTTNLVRFLDDGWSSAAIHFGGSRADDVRRCSRLDDGRQVQRQVWRKWRRRRMAAAAWSWQPGLLEWRRW